MPDATAKCESFEWGRLPLFADLPRETLAILKPEMLKHFQNGATIFHRGDEQRHLVVLLEGQACVYRDEIFITCRSAPAVVGEQAFIDETDRSATLIAQGFVKALVLPEVTTSQLMQNPTFVRNLLRTVSCKLREATEERARHYRREELLFTEFKAHASETMVDSLLATGIDYGSPRFIEDAVILYSDIRNFTEYSNSMSPDDIAEQLSTYLSDVVDTVHNYGGLVDKFIGDAVLAVWGYTQSNRKAEDSFSCAQQLLRVAGGKHFGGHPIRIGIGIEVGKVFSGNVGNDSKKQFTVLGPPVNLASRFESKAKELGAPIVLGQTAYQALPSEIQGLLKRHPEQEIKGAARQTIYTFEDELGGSTK